MADTDESEAFDMATPIRPESACVAPATDAREAGGIHRPITFFPNLRAKTTASERTINWIRDKIASDEYRERVEAIRKLGKTEARGLKAKLPCVMFAGFFSSRVAPVADNMIRSSGLVSLDFDDLGEGLCRDLKTKLAGDRHTLLAFVSPSGKGIKLVVPFAGGADYAEAFAAASRYYHEKFRIKADPACRDVGRLCFVSHDPDLVWNGAAAPHIFAEDREKPEEGTPRTSPLSSTTYTLQSTPCTLPPTPLHPTPYTLQDRGEGNGGEVADMLRARNTGRTRLESLRASGDGGVAWCYEKLILERFPAKSGQRNEWLLNVVPFLFRAVSRPIAARLVELAHDIHASNLWHDTKPAHLESFDSLWRGCVEKYPSELSPRELAVYEQLDGPETAAFRICRDLALKGNGKFYMPSDHLGWRIYGNGWRILAGFEKLEILKVVARGQRRAAGMTAKATTYRMPLLPPQVAAEVPQDAAESANAA